VKKKIKLVTVGISNVMNLFEFARIPCLKQFICIFTFMHQNIHEYYIEVEMYIIHGRYFEHRSV